MTPRPPTLKSLLWIASVSALGLAATLVIQGARASQGSVAPSLDCPSCDDFNACTTDSCDTTTGTCRHEPLSCDDGNPCTSDVCDPSPTFGGCRHAPAGTGSLCDD